MSDHLFFLLSNNHFSFQCVAHFLHLCVNDALKIDYVAEIISKVQEWTIICRTINGRAILKRHQEMHNLTPKKLVMVSVPDNRGISFLMV